MAKKNTKISIQKLLRKEVNRYRTEKKPITTKNNCCMRRRYFGSGGGSPPESTEVNIVLIGDSLMQTGNGLTTDNSNSLYEWNGTDVENVGQLSTANITTPGPRLARAIYCATGKDTVISTSTSGGSEFSPYLDNNNWSISGNLYAPMKTKVDAFEEFLQRPVDAFFICLGINDARGTTDLSVIESDAQSLITRLNNDFNNPKIFFINIGTTETGVTARVTAVRNIISNLVANNANISMCFELSSVDNIYFYDNLHLSQYYNNVLGETMGNYAVSNIPVSLSPQCDSVVSSISSSGFWHRMSHIDCLLNVSDKVIVSIDNLGNRDAGASGNTSVLAIQNDVECVEFLNNSFLSVQDPKFVNQICSDSFSVFFQVKLLDGQPATAISNVIRGGDESTGSRFWIDFRSSGQITVAYSVGGTNVFGQTSSTPFANGPMADFVNIAVTLESGSFIRIYVDGVLQSMNTSLNGNISGLVMANFNANESIANNQFGIGAKYSAPSFVGYLRNMIIQPVLYDATDIANLSSL